LRLAGLLAAMAEPAVVQEQEPVAQPVEFH
jgi:hypothetical protein